MMQMRCHLLSVLFVVVGLLAGCKPSPPSGGGKSAPVATATFTMKSLTAERAGGHLHLTLTAQVKNPGSAALTLAPPTVQLLANGTAAEPFISPGLEPAVLAPGAEMETALHWWLAAEEVTGALTLDIAGARAEVKSAGTFALDLLPERQPVPLTFPNWKTP